MIAVIAIVAVLVLTLVPQAHSGIAGVWLAMLPILFIGLVSPLSLVGLLAKTEFARVPVAPALQASFQRPPPFRLG
jgi:hypothetical protein